MFIVQLPNADAISPFTPTLEVYERFQRRDDRDFDKQRSDNRSDLESRYRLGLDWKDGIWSARLQYQYAQDWIWNPTKTNTTQNSDLLQAYVQAKLGSGDFQVGRYRLALGSSRLIGLSEWSFPDRGFEGFHYRSADLDLFGFREVVAPTVPHFDRIGGVSYRTGLGLSTVIYKHDANTAGAKTDLFTASQWVHKSARQWTFDGEGGYQFGKNLGLSQDAWALHGNVSYQVDKKDLVFLEGDVATGGVNGHHDHSFDTLYASNHGLYGSMDLFGWRNMTEMGIGAVRRLNARTQVKLSTERFGLYDATDAWYASSGSTNQGAFGGFVDPTGKAGKDLGQEFDLDFVHTIRKDETVDIGASALQAGRFQKTLNQGHASTQYWLTVNYSKKF